MAVLPPFRLIGREILGCGMFGGGGCGDQRDRLDGIVRRAGMTIDAMGGGDEEAIVGRDELMNDGVVDCCGVAVAA